MIIEPSRRLLRLGFGELWADRELLFFLAWRDVKVRYKQTALGASWAILQPLLLMAIFSIFFGKLAGVGSDGLPYPLFALTALVPWSVFSQTLIGASNSLVSSATMITKVYFPRLLLPLGIAGSFVLDFLIALLLLAGAMAYFGFGVSARVLWVPLLCLLTLMVAVAFGIWLAALNVRYRDVKYAVPFIVQVWLFLTPIAYPASIVPERYQGIYSLNPMVGVIEGFRWALLGRPFPREVLMTSLVMAIVVLLAGVAYFRSVERTFADVI